MKKIFTCFIFLFASIAAKAQFFDAAIFDFDSSNTYLYYWGNYKDYKTLNSALFIDTVDYKRNQWQIGRPNKRVFDSAFTYPNAIVTDTSAPCLPNDTSVFVLKIASSGFPNEYELYWFSFVYQLDIDTGDIAMLEVSIDSGKAWINVLKDTNNYFDWTRPGAIKPDLATSTTKWDSAVIVPHVLPTPYNDTLLLRFTLITGSDTTARDGWMIDHIATQYPTEGVADISRPLFQLYPNPASSDVRLSFAQGLSRNCILSVIDGLGRQVFVQGLNKGSTDYSLSVRGWTKGLYFIELADVKGNKSVRKLMVE